jgi:hypothetical protein
LLSEAGQQSIPTATSTVHSEGVHRAADGPNVGSPETYLGYDRAEHFGSPGGFEHDQVKSYVLPEQLPRNAWALVGQWTVGEEKAALHAPGGRIVVRFHARDVHLVLAQAATATRCVFRVTLDDQPAAQNHGMDVDENGEGVVREQRLYQLIRQSDSVRDRTFTIEFLDAVVEAFAFTFG